MYYFGVTEDGWFNAKSMLCHLQKLSSKVNICIAKFVELKVLTSKGIQICDISHKGDHTLLPFLVGQSFSIVAVMKLNVLTQQLSSWAVSEKSRGIVTSLMLFKITNCCCPLPVDGMRSFLSLQVPLSWHRVSTSPCIPCFVLSMVMVLVTMIVCKSTGCRLMRGFMKINLPVSLAVFAFFPSFATSQGRMQNQHH